MRDILDSIYEKVQKNPDLEESEVKDIFVDEGFFQSLNYEGFGIDIRSEKYIVGKKRPDYFCRDEHGNIIFVIEFKKPSLSEDLNSHRKQLWEQYVVPLRANFGILTDGNEIILYKRKENDDYKKIFRDELNNIFQDQVSKLKKLSKPILKYDSKEKIKDYLDKLETVSVGQVQDGEKVGENEFLESFRLEKGTIVHKLLEKTYELLEYYLNKNEDNFPKDAYEFWKEYYAMESKNINWYSLPKEWREIAGEAKNMQKIIFCVETLQSFIGRLMLAKSCEDYDFPTIDIKQFLLEKTTSYRKKIPLISYLISGDKLLNKMREELVESVFEEDLYYWWITPARDREASTPKELYNLSIAPEVEHFCEALVGIFIGICRFDFSDLKGDLLGDLYQNYFSPEIRKALGEFYTPPSISRYIIDSIDYSNNVGNKRLIDDSCGSGTFLVEALNRYKDEIASGSTPVDWGEELKNLCEKSRIVGLDIHPFAVVLAQIRFMIEILPEYKKGVQQSDLVLRRLPIYRTDSLIDESKITESVQTTLTTSFEGDTIDFTMPLPIRKGGTFQDMSFELPSFKYVQSETQPSGISNKQDYFSSLLAVFDAVKDYRNKGIYEIEKENLKNYFESYFSRQKNIKQISLTFLKTANEFLEKVKELQEKYNDGRLLKLIEDVVLGVIIKNYIKYDYVVGNPPWVSKHSRFSGEDQDRRMKNLYLSAWKETDMYLQFMERGLQMLRKGGKLGYIVSNRYLYAMAGKEIRALLAKNKIMDLVDFTDYPIFEEATNYSSIICVEKEVENDDWTSFIENRKFVNNYKIKAARVKDWSGDISSLMDILQKRKSRDTVDIFDIDSNFYTEKVLLEENKDKVKLIENEVKLTFSNKKIKLSEKLPYVDIWPVCPKNEIDLINKIEEGMDKRLGDERIIRDNKVEKLDNLVGDEIHVGIQTSGDGIYVVNPITPISMDKLKELKTLTVNPKTDTIQKEFTVETDMLKVDIGGRNVKRWLPDWNDRLVFIPYIPEKNRARLLAPNELKKEYPNTYEYFCDKEVLKVMCEESTERKKLISSLAAKFNLIGKEEDYSQIELSDKQYKKLSEKLYKNNDMITNFDDDYWWYRFMRRQNIESLPLPKVLSVHPTQYNKLCFDEKGIMANHNASVFSVMLPEDDKYEIAAILNSSVVEFYHKHFARQHKGGAYSYIENDISKWPIAYPNQERKEELRKYVKKILKIKNIEMRIKNFPGPYIAKYYEEGEEFLEIEYTPSKDIECNPSIQSNLENDRFVNITGDIKLRDSSISTKEKAKYVCNYFKNKKLEKNNNYTIPIPRKNELVKDILNEYNEDLKTLKNSNINKIEEYINQSVYELFNITDGDEIKIIKDYNSQYKKKK